MEAISSPEADGIVAELLLTPEGRKDPYPRYRKLHEIAPLLRTSFGPVVASRFEDVQHALRDPKLGRPEDDMADPMNGMGNGRAEMRREMAAAGGQYVRSMLDANPPEHTRLRRLVSREFTPGRVEGLKPAILAMVDEICDRMADEGTVDIMEVLAFPLPVTVIGELLGVPEADRPGFQPIVQDVVATLEMGVSDEEMAKAQVASEKLAAYFGDLIKERRANPADDLLTALAAAPTNDDRLSELEIISTAILLFAAGFETTTNLIGNGLLAFLSNPDQLQRLRDDPSLAPSAVEEVLRYDSPVQINGRAALADTELAGVPLPKGSFVVCLQGGGNHDPSHWTNPERFDIGRQEGQPLSFGGGIHYCLGAGLARAEGDVVFRRVLERFSRIEPLDPDPPRKTGITLRGLAHLPVALTPA